MDLPPGRSDASYPRCLVEEQREECFLTGLQSLLLTFVADVQAYYVLSEVLYKVTFFISSSSSEDSKIPDFHYIFSNASFDS